MSKDAPAMGELPFSHVVLIFFFFFFFFCSFSLVQNRKETSGEMVGYASRRCRGVLKGQRGEVANIIFLP